MKTDVPCTTVNAPPLRGKRAAAYPKGATFGCVDWFLYQPGAPASAEDAPEDLQPARRAARPGMTASDERKLMGYVR